MVVPAVSLHTYIISSEVTFPTSRPGSFSGNSTIITGKSSSILLDEIAPPINNSTAKGKPQQKVSSPEWQKLSSLCRNLYLSLEASNENSPKDFDTLKPFVANNIKSALQALGLKPGTFDGKISSQDLAAIRILFERAKLYAGTDTPFAKRLEQFGFPNKASLADINPQTTAQLLRGLLTQAIAVKEDATCILPRKDPLNFKFQNIGIKTKPEALKAHPIN